MVVKGRNKAKRELAENCGLEYRTDTGSEPFDRVIEAVGSEKTISSTRNFLDPMASTVSNQSLSLLPNEEFQVPVRVSCFLRIRQ